MTIGQLVLVRHGESEWNRANLFTGWVDVDLTELGRAQAIQAGVDLVAEGLLPDVVHTSLQRRAIRTAELALEQMRRSWIPVRRSWRLNERHYGALQGKNKSETAESFGAEQVKIWRRSFDVPPPPLSVTDSNWGYDDRYARLAPEVLPASECLADVVTRLVPYWVDRIIPDLRAGKTVLVAAHGNSLRALVMHLDGIPKETITELNIPTGIPLRYELNEAFVPIGAPDANGLRGQYVGDPDTAAAAAAAVAAQAG